MKAVEKVQKTLALKECAANDLPVLSGQGDEDGAFLMLFSVEGAVKVMLPDSAQAYSLARAATAAGDFLLEREAERTMRVASRG